jgi:CheY-like chemotaxis protein
MAPYNILLVDDELHALRALARTLRQENNVFTATNGEDALSILEKNEIALIITDQRMPGMTGIELLAKVRQKYPDTVRIILTAYAVTDKNLLVDAINVGYVYRYLTKPWEPEEIIAIVGEGIKTYEATRLPETKRMRIGEILVDNGIISESQLDAALELQKHDGRRLGEIIVDLGYANEESICSCYALQLGLPYMPVSQFAIEPEIAELLSQELANRHAVVPVNVIGQVLTIATSEPLSDRAKSEIERETGYKVTAVCALLKDIKLALEKYYSQ